MTTVRGSPCIHIPVFSTTLRRIPSSRSIITSATSVWIPIRSLMMLPEFRIQFLHPKGTRRFSQRLFRVPARARPSSMTRWWLLPVLTRLPGVRRLSRVLLTLKAARRGLWRKCRPPDFPLDTIWRTAPPATSGREERFSLTGALIANRRTWCFGSLSRLAAPRAITRLILWIAIITSSGSKSMPSGLFRSPALFSAPPGSPDLMRARSRRWWSGSMRRPHRAKSM